MTIDILHFLLVSDLFEYLLSRSPGFWVIMSGVGVGGR